jgi:hypothetical protein
MKWIFYTFVWAVISLLAGAAGSYFFSLDFWLGSLIAGGALIVNGVVAEWEDYRRDRGS